ncbi:LuxR C-terminal-related transcriptional regulator [Buttiauxella sp. WJP83]|uniref:LuxR C-terminal-related transcriptional regulator n=1 Tax=Buttiauxella sp. WJP83 TaxID=2986951 RepID=UPI0022DE435B|nr:LuxR C-terminal-related transcriptional regulator [Buttiauxella sp. WJP83]WBM68862.1 LuxR C-terminal-related transcriptional regulator [Buttiauxella sp. WJP83]
MSEIDKKIFLITNRSLQNHLLLNFLAQKSDVPVVFLDVNHPHIPEASEDSIILYDVQASSRRASKRWSELLNRSKDNFRGHLINCPKSLSVYEKMAWPFFESMIFCDCSTEVLLDLISSTESTPIKMRGRYLSKSSLTSSTTHERINNLTERECEILNEICKGESNFRIANNFFISEHTVRTHIYNIFKKISVSNRIQAANWANDRLNKSDSNL